MSHQTGIEASDDLKVFLGTAKQEDSSVRLIKIKIENESLQLAESADVIDSWEADYDGLVIPCLEANTPCYIFYRTDTKGSHGYQWIFIAYSPDKAQVRQKMLYASTKATIRREFGGGMIVDEMFGTNKDDVCLSGYQKHKQAESAPPPLTMSEIEIEEVKQNETRADIGVDTKHQTIQGVQFPLTQRARQALDKFKEGNVNYVQLRINIKDEEIDLVKADICVANDLAEHFPEDTARYHLYNFLHTFEGDEINSVVFIYSMPGYCCPVKERMLYSSCTSVLVSDLSTNYAAVDKKMEVSSGSEINEETLFDEIHPKTNIVREKFAKPKGPGGRGPRRMVKPNENV